MDIYCRKCGCFFKEWSHGERVCCNEPMKELVAAKLGGVVIKKAGFHVIPDIQPYQAVAVDAKTGKTPVITSRKQHKEFLARNGYVEVGNEVPKQREYDGDHNVRRELTEATHQVLSQYR